MIRKYVLNGVLAGLLIVIGACALLAVLPNSLLPGALMFAGVFLFIAYKSYPLFTNMTGYLVENNCAAAWTAVFVTLLGNIAGAWAFGALVRLGLPNLIASGQTILINDLAYPLRDVLIRAFFAGVLMYVAEDLFRQHRTVVGFLFAIPIILYVNFNHAIIDVAVFSIVGVTITEEVLTYFAAVIAGNMLGALVPPVIRRLASC